MCLVRAQKSLDEAERKVEHQRREDVIAAKLVQDLRTGSSRKITEAVAMSVVHAVIPILDEDRSLVDVPATAFVIGDIHGQLTDLCRVLDLALDKAPLVFMGDYVDRGKNSLEVICLLFALKIARRESVFLLRGNHESGDINARFGFLAELQRKSCLNCWERFNEAFDHLPVAAVLGKRVFCCHAGISESVTLETVLAFERPAPIAEGTWLSDLTWSDPDKTVVDFTRNYRGAGVKFGRAPLKRFLESHGLAMLVRSHQDVEKGFDFQFEDASCLTVFSASDYGEKGNAAAIAFFDGGNGKIFTSSGGPFEEAETFEAGGAAPVSCLPWVLHTKGECNRVEGLAEGGLRVIVVGNYGVGKRSLIAALAHGAGSPPREEYGSEKAVFRVGGREEAICFVSASPDTAFDAERPLLYAEDAENRVFVVAFSANHPTSLSAALEKWIPEIKEPSRALLVGLKTDFLRVDAREAIGKANSAGAAAYLECSALTGDGLADLIEALSALGRGEVVQQLPAVPPNLGWFVEHMRSAVTRGKMPKITEDFALDLCEMVKPILLLDATLLELPTPLVVVGDLHGQIEDLCRILDKAGTTPLLFLGDYVDRGPNSVPVICTLLAMKVLNPSSVFLLRGNHETAAISGHESFGQECFNAFGRLSLCWTRFNEVFDCLPMAAVVDNKFFCVHGGPGPDVSREAFAGIERPAEIPEKGWVKDLIWSDPGQNEGFVPNGVRQAGFLFGRDALGGFLESWGCRALVRSHQVCDEAYRFDFNDTSCLTIFSSLHPTGVTDAIACLVLEADGRANVLSISRSSGEVIELRLHLKETVPMSLEEAIEKPVVDRSIKLEDLDDSVATPDAKPREILGREGRDRTNLRTWWPLFVLLVIVGLVAVFIGFDNLRG
jgi:diadenosine tetraphosphatase ApaH/serine/threonine PP2A family protein phosphatase